MIDGMISRYRREIGDENATVIACGGLAEGIVGHCETKIVVDKCLLLDGLMAIWKKNNG
jgi:type III pantothenate kinase